MLPRVATGVRLHALTRCDPICKRSRIPWREAITMAVIIYPITPRFAAEISDVDLSCPIGPSDLAAGALRRRAP